MVLTLLDLFSRRFATDPAESIVIPQVVLLRVAPTVRALAGLPVLASALRVPTQSTRLGARLVLPRVT